MVENLGEMDSFLKNKKQQLPGMGVFTNETSVFDMSWSSSVNGRVLILKPKGKGPSSVPMGTLLASSTSAPDH